MRPKEGGLQHVCLCTPGTLTARPMPLMAPRSPQGVCFLTRHGRNSFLAYSPISQRWFAYELNCVDQRQQVCLCLETQGMCICKLLSGRHRGAVPSEGPGTEGPGNPGGSCPRGICPKMHQPQIKAKALHHGGPGSPPCFRDQVDPGESLSGP